MKLVDLTHPIRSGVPSYTGGSAPEFTPRATFETKGRMSTTIAMGTHTGTHVDAPLHFIFGGTTIADLPLERVAGMATLLDVSSLPCSNRIIDPQAFNALAERFPPGDIALVYTGVDALYGTAAYSAQYPCLATESVRWLIQKGIRAYATDAISVDLMDQPGFENHQMLLGAGIPLVEGVNNLKSVGRDRFFFLALPLMLAGLEAAPARAVALLGLE